MGNNNVVLDNSGSDIENNFYYPFELPYSINQDEKQPYKFNGKEFDTMHGLNQYDYAARQHDPVLGRFTSMNPLAEKYYSISPYVYCLDNPLKFVDTDGRVVRNAQGLIRFFSKKKNVEAVGGTEGTSLIRGTVGEIIANDGKTKMSVFLATHVREQDDITDKWGWRGVKNEDRYDVGTNCFGSIHLDGVLLPLDQAEVDPFLKADGYKTMSAKQSNYEIGDIISWGGMHFIIATGKDEKGNMIWFSKMVGYKAVKGTLSEIQNFNTQYGSYYGKIQKSTTLYRQTYKSTKLTKEDWDKIARRTKQQLEAQLELDMR